MRFADVPLLEAAAALAAQGYATGASDRNWASCETAVKLHPNAPLWQRKLLTDPQTSGGLLVACSPEVAPAVLDIFREEGFERARVIGRLERGEPGITIT
jgi:selenide,water dikinase